MDPPVQVTVTESYEGTIVFVEDVVDVDASYNDFVVFDPPTIKIRAPAPFFAGKPTQDLRYPVREGEKEIRYVIIENIRIDLEERVIVRVTKVKKPDADDSMDLAGVPVSVALEYRPPGEKSLYQLFVAQWATAETVSVTVFGPPDVIKRLQIEDGDALELLREDLVVVYDIATKVRNRQPEIDEAGDDGLVLTLNGIVLASILKLHNLTSAKADAVTAKLTRVK
jgi:hypothetical protein